MCAATLVALLGATAATASAQNVLENPGFEEPGFPPMVFDGWTDFGNGSGNVSQVSFDIQEPFEGLFCAKLFGQFTGGENASGMFQDFETAPGETWKMSIRAIHQAGDAIVGPNFGLANIEWRDESLQLLDFQANVTIDAESPTDEWLLFESEATAPEGTAVVRFSAFFLQIDGVSPGAIFYDAATFERIEASCPADVNGDGMLNILDFVAFQELFVQSDPGADCDENGQWNILDFVCYQGLFQAGCP
jgi:hypothetical protein